MTSASNAAVAARILALREAVGMDLDELAQRTGTSREEAGRYESGNVDIPVSFLFKVGQACGVDLTVLLSGQDAHLTGYSLVRRGQGLTVDRRSDYAYKSLASRFSHRRMEPFLVTVEPGRDVPPRTNTHPGQEFLYLLDGRLRVYLKDSVHDLEPGDSLFFDSRHPHAMQALDGKRACFLDVIV